MNNMKRVLAAAALGGAVSFGALASPASAAPVAPTPDSTTLDMTELVKTPGDKLQDNRFLRLPTSVHDKIAAEFQEAMDGGPRTNLGPNAGNQEITAS